MISFITQEYRRFAEFCEACRRDRYIGLCYGPPGVGKTLSARYYAKWFQLLTYPPYAFGADTAFAAVTGTTTVFYTPAVVNTPGRIAQDIQLSRHHLQTLALEALFREQAAAQKAKTPPERLRRAKRGKACWTTLAPPSHGIRLGRRPTSPGATRKDESRLPIRLS